MTASVWALRSLQGQEIPRSRREAVTLRLSPDHDITGTASCNDGEPGQVLFGDRESGGLPVFLDRGFPPAMLAEVEAQALRMAIETAKHLHPADMRKGLA